MNFSGQNLADIAELLRMAAQVEIMPRFRRLGPAEIRSKSENDLVTDADEAAEDMITAGLARLFPDCLVVGEEATTRDPTLPERLRDAELAFTVDPIDGTANFVMGVAVFGVMVAAIMRGTVVGAIILDPVCDDMAMALRGQGAWLQRSDGSRTDLRVAPPVPLSRMGGVAAWRYLPEPVRSTVACNLTKVAGSWDFRCAAHQYRALASGHCHFLLFNRLMPWDHLPGWLLHQEAGGFSAKFDESPYEPGDVGGGLICASDRASWEAVRKGLLGNTVASAKK